MIQVLSRAAGLVVVLVCTLVASAFAQAATGATRPVTVDAHFHQVSGGKSVLSVLSDGRYVLLLSAGSGRFGTLIDEQTHRRTPLDPGCAVAALAGATFVGTSSLAVLDCPPTLSKAPGVPPLRLYSIATRRWRTVTVNDPTCQATDVRCSLSVGARWIQINEVHVTCASCQPTIAYENLANGTLSRRSPKTSPTTFLDLDSPRLVTKVCSPLAVPRNGAFVTGLEPPLGRYMIAQTGSGDELERCGTRLHERLRGVPSGGDHNALIWGGSPITGIVLPALRAFTIPLPAALRHISTTSDTFTLSRDFIWITSPEGLWQASRPKLLSGGVSAR